jgi:hypothetical protein
VARLAVEYWPDITWNGGPACCGICIRPSVLFEQRVQLTQEQLQALIVGLPWERLGDLATFKVL